MSISFRGRTLVTDRGAVQLPWPVLVAVEQEDKVLVLLDPLSYLSDPGYKSARRRGAPAVRNLVALTKAGETLWEAQLPETSDYYYRIVSASPLVANSCSSQRCEIDPDTGSIRKKESLR